jgi:acid phosphatase
LRKTRRQFLSGASALAVLPYLGGRAAAAQQDSALSFLVVGDWGKPDLGADALAVATQMGKEAEEIDANFVISTGDNFYENGVQSVNDPLWQTAFEKVYSAVSLQVPWYVVLGNHDYDGEPNAELAYALTSSRWTIPSRYYAIQKVVSGHASADFFFLDTNMLADVNLANFWLDAGVDAKEQLDWLDTMLAASRATWKIVVGHHPIYSGGEHGDTPALREALLPLLKRHLVRVYINGHDHNLEHIERDGVHFLTSGSGAEQTPARPVDGTLFVAASIGFLSATLSADLLGIAFISDEGTVLHRSSIPA